ncbi:MAG: alpha-amylase family glycosyl hydrolase [Myxococcota bacterium]
MRNAVVVLGSLVTVLACKHGDSQGENIDLPTGDDEPGLANADGWWRSSTFYEVFVRSFADSDGDGVGDFQGLTAQLDYLNDGDPSTDTDLEVEGIWLMPINPSPSYHGYDVTDYQEINPDYGTLDDFDAFIEAAHARGIKVIMDFVLNHGSSEHPWFRAALAHPEAPERDYFIFREDKPTSGFERPWDGANTWHAAGSEVYYGIFWSGMPDWNLAHPEVETMMFDAMRFWLARGVDGFRVDAVRYLIENDAGEVADLPETHAFIRTMRREIHRDYPQALFVAEAWTDSSRIQGYYGEGDEFQLAFSFDIAGAVIESAKDGLRAGLNQAMNTTASAFSPDVNFQAPFLTNHDMVRVKRQLGESEDGAMRISAATLFALPGTPFVYYGEEIGMMGGAGGQDEEKRTPMRWTPEENGQFGFSTATPWRTTPEAEGIDVESQTDDPDSLLTLYRRLIRLRNESSALNDGTVDILTVNGAFRGVVAFLRENEDERTVFVANFDRAATSDAVQINVAGTPTVLLAEGESGSLSSDGSTLDVGPLAAQGFVFVRLD